MIVLHVITGLNDGGAEGVLYRLCRASTKVTHVVVSLTSMGKYGPMLLDAGVKVIALGLPRGRVTVEAIWRLWKIVRNLRPQVVQTWMYHADLMGGVVARMAGVRNVVWGVRHSTLEEGVSSRKTIWVAKVCSWFSGWVPLRIVVCARQAMAVHVQMGYNADRMVYIPNGYDVHRFKPDYRSRELLRVQLKVSDITPLIGMVGRYDAQKDHSNLLHALSLLKDRGLNFVCVLAGTNLDSDNKELNHLLQKYGLTDEVKLLSRRDDVPELMNALDVHVLSSAFGEAFPNVVAEAMACGTPCVTTDVGDAGDIVSDCGWVVAPRNAVALAGAMEAALHELQNSHPAWTRRQAACRLRITNLFSLKKMVGAFEEVWGA